MGDGLYANDNSLCIQLSIILSRKVVLWMGCESRKHALEIRLLRSICMGFRDGVSMARIELAIGLPLQCTEFPAACKSLPAGL